MKCQRCEEELPGASVICRNCEYNNASHGFREWERKRKALLDPQSGDSGLRTTARQHTEARLIRFPVKSEIPPVNPSVTAETENQEPAWRRQLSEKVRQHREQRQAADASRIRQESENPAPHPILEKAMRRLQSELPVPRTAPISGGAAQATARALDYETQQEKLLRPRTEPVPAAPPSPAPTQPLVSETAITSSVMPATPTKKTEVIQVNALRQNIIPAEATGSQTAISNELPQEVAVEPAAQTYSPALDEDYSDDELIEEEIREAAALPAVEAVSFYSRQYPNAGKAPFLGRVAAFIIDLEVVAFSFLPFFTAFTLSEAVFQRSTAWAMIGIALVMTFLYHLITTAIAGRTFGMAVFRLRMANAANESEPPSLNQCIRRAAATVAALVLFPLNLLVIALSPERQSLADQFSNTTVVRK